uniref:Uncharacterized protein n=1 Tax=Ditylenchus dipsaci TaxID=166011 RepID=A0A915DBW8_9BILA
MEEEKDQRIKTLILFLAKGSPGISSSFSSKSFYLYFFRQFIGRGFQSQVQKSSARVRSATRMLIAVVTCYLLANMLDVFLASWEYLDGQSLAEMSGFYTVATDVSSLLSVLSSSLRLPIYLLVGDKLLQTEIKRTLRSICLLFIPIDYKGLGKKSIFDAKFKGSHHPSSPKNYCLQNSKQGNLNQQNHHLLDSPLPLSSSCESSGFINNNGIGLLIQARGVIFTSSKNAPEMYVERKISSAEQTRFLNEFGAVSETKVMQWTKEI